MTERGEINEKARAFFEDLWKRGDPWELESSEFEQAKYMRQLSMLDQYRYARALEIGCGAGSFTRLLAGITEQVVALDISPTAIECAARRDLAQPRSISAWPTSWTMMYGPRAHGTLWS